MRALASASVVLAAFVVFAAEGVRNPFWPEGYKGEMTPISAEPRVKPKPSAKDSSDKKSSESGPSAVAKVQSPAEKKAVAAAAKASAEAAAKAAREAELRRAIAREDWVNARRALKISSPARFRSDDGTVRSSIAINGNIYVDGDLVSVTYDNVRFTWRIKGLDGRESLKLMRVKACRLDPEVVKKAGGK